MHLIGRLLYLSIDRNSVSHLPVPDIFYRTAGLFNIIFANSVIVVVASHPIELIVAGFETKT